MQCDVVKIDSDKIKRLKPIVEKISKDKQKSVALQILSDDNRFKLLSLLNEERICVCDLSNLLEMSQSAVSHQLKKLRVANIVTSKKEGKSVFYHLNLTCSLTQIIIKILDMALPYES